MIDPRDLAICTIHGTSGHYSGDYARRYAWPQLQLKQLRKHTPAGFTVYAYGNLTMPEHRAFLEECEEVRYIDGGDVPHGHYPHVWPIRNWLTLQAIKTHKIVLHLDSDAFPVDDDWLETYGSALTENCPCVAASLREIGLTQSDRLFLMFTRESFLKHRFDFSPIGAGDPGGGISKHLEATGLNWLPLLRSNRLNYHRSQAGIYDDRVYHQGAGSRLPKWMDSALRFKNDKFFQLREMLIQQVLVDQVFFNTDAFLEQLRGQAEALNMDEELLKASETDHLEFHAWHAHRMKRGRHHEEIGYS